MGSATPAQPTRSPQTLPTQPRQLSETLQLNNNPCDKKKDLLEGERFHHVLVHKRCIYLSSSSPVSYVSRTRETTSRQSCLRSHWRRETRWCQRQLPERRHGGVGEAATVGRAWHRAAAAGRDGECRGRRPCRGAGGIEVATLARAL